MKLRTADARLDRAQYASQPAVDGTSAFRVGVLAVAAPLYAWVLTRGSFNPFGAEQFGLVFNSMLSHMLEGRWDIDPASIGYEAFVHDGRTYAYFGPFPALLRLPLAALPHWLLPEWRGLHVERLSCWLAIMVGITAQASAVMTALARAVAPIRKQLAPPLLLVCAMSGAPMLLSWRGALIYHEAILWAWALAMVFVALALPAVQRPEPISGHRLCGLGLCAGLCLLTRSTTGASLYLATGLLVLFQLGRHGRPALRWSFWAPASVLGVFIALTGVVNQGRWGNPLVFANLSMQSFIVDLYPDRLIRVQRYALFDWHRIDTGLLYYVFPVWTDQLEHALPLETRLLDLYDAIEQPASSLLVTDPALCLLSVLGAVAILRRRVFAGEALLAGGMLLTPVLMVTAWSLTFRYRVEFAPLLLVLSCIGLDDRAPGLGTRGLGRATLAVWLLCLLQVGGAMTAGWSYAREPFGPSSGYAALSLRCVVAPGSCTGAGSGRLSSTGIRD